MKSFIKTTLAVLLGLFLWCLISIFFTFTFFGAIAAIGSTKTVLPSEGILSVNCSEFTFAEQSSEDDPMGLIKGENISVIGILDAVKAVKNAAEDPAIKFIYLRPDMVSGGIAELEEFRAALEYSKNVAGKPIIAFIENPSNASYYLASVADKVYMSSYPGGMNMMFGLSSQLIFLKDILDKMGVNMQFIRHGKYKSAGEMFSRSECSPENRLQNQVLINSIWDSWSDQMASARGISSSDFNDMIDNLELNFPGDFLEKNLVDSLMTKEALAEKLCNLYGAEDIDDIKVISLKDYISGKSVPDFKKKDKVAIIYADGQIVDGDATEDVAGDRFANIIRDVRKDSSVKAVVFRVSSPGGSVVASEKIKEEIRLLKEKKTVIASYGVYAASGGYWISAACDHIFANNTTITGSIGVFSMIPEFSKTTKNLLHINIETINSNLHSDMLSGTRAMDEDELNYMQASVEDIYDRFTNLVAEGRNMEVAAVDEIAQGRVWAGCDAVKIGLVDEIGTLEDAIAYAEASVGNPGDFQIVSYPKPLTTMEKFMDLVENKASAGIFKGTALENVEKAFKNAGEWTEPHTYARLPYEMEIR